MVAEKAGKAGAGGSARSRDVHPLAGVGVLEAGRFGNSSTIGCFPRPALRSTQKAATVAAVKVVTRAELKHGVGAAGWGAPVARSRTPKRPSTITSRPVLHQGRFGHPGNA